MEGKAGAPPPRAQLEAEAATVADSISSHFPLARHVLFLRNGLRWCPVRRIALNSVVAKRDDRGTTTNGQPRLIISYHYVAEDDRRKIGRRYSPSPVMSGDAVFDEHANAA